MSESTSTSTAGNGVIATVEGYIAALYAKAASLFSAFHQAETEVATVTAEHPEIIAAAESLEALAPPEVRAGISTAEEVLTAVNNIAAHAEAVTPPAAA